MSVQAKRKTYKKSEHEYRNDISSRRGHIVGSEKVYSCIRSITDTHLYRILFIRFISPLSCTWKLICSGTKSYLQLNKRIYYQRSQTISWIYVLIEQYSPIDLHQNLEIMYYYILNSEIYIIKHFSNYYDLTRISVICSPKAV